MNFPLYNSKYTRTSNSNLLAYTLIRLRWLYPDSYDETEDDNMPDADFLVGILEEN